MMASFLLRLASLAGVPAVLGQYVVPASPGNTNPVLDGFVSFSIEFSSFPDFAGASVAVWLRSVDPDSHAKPSVPCRAPSAAWLTIS